MVASLCIAYMTPSTVTDQFDCLFPGNSIVYEVENAIGMQKAHDVCAIWPAVIENTEM